MPWEPPAQAFQGKGWEPPSEAFGKPSAPGRKPGAAEATDAYLEANKPSVLTRALMNLKRSAGRYAENGAAMSGGPASGPSLSMGDDGVVRNADGSERKIGPKETLEDVKNFASAAGRFLQHPIDTLKESFAEDPINTAAIVAGAARQAGPKVISGVRSAPSGVRGMKAEAMERVPLPAVNIPRLGRVQVEAKVPRIVADAAKSASIGGTVGGAIGSTVGAVTPMSIMGGGATGTVIGANTGAVLGAAKNLTRGYRKGTAAFREAQRQAKMPPRAPLTAPPSSVPRGTPTATTPPPPAAPGTLPSGRKPGGIQNQRVEPTSPPAGTQAVLDPLDAIAAEIGYKKPYSKLTASQQMEVKIAQKAAEQAATKAAEPGITGTITAEPDIPTSGAPSPDVTPFGQAMQKALERLKETNQIPKDFQPGTLGGPDPALKVFDTGSGKPVIDSSKSRFKAPVANPDLLKPEQLTFQIDRLSKKPNLTMGETNLLRQLRDEVKKRGTK
jgi:hypothetical protein